MPSRSPTRRVTAPMPVAAASSPLPRGVPLVVITTNDNGCLGAAIPRSWEPREGVLIGGAPDLQTGRMGTPDEAHAVNAVIDRLAGRFPQLQRDQIASVVHE